MMRYIGKNATLFASPAQPFDSKSEVMVIYAVLAECTTVIIKNLLSIITKLINYHDISINIAPDQWGEMGN